ncbi:MAG: NUDIX hydrolase [Candidatus Zixiibacteriota bacterium]
MTAKYGRPHHRGYRFETTRRELERIRASQVDGRNHDVTLYIRKGEQIVVIAKHIYPPGLYRAPSGGLKPGESFESGIHREVAEETGCRISIDKFLLQTAVRFHHVDDSVPWRSFVFLADYLDGDFEYTDRHEIREVRLAGWAEFVSFGRIMRATETGGLHYRAALHETVAALVQGPTSRPPHGGFEA